MTRRFRTIALLVVLSAAVVACMEPPPDRARWISVAIGGAGSGTLASDGGEINCGSVCGARLTVASELILTATPASGSMFAGWGGACSGPSPTCSVRLGQDVMVTAYFRPTTKVVAAGGYHSCALRPTGDVWCWGRNQDGQIGAGIPGNVSPLPPTAVRGLTNVAAIALGGFHSCALRVGGAVVCWGDNRQGPLGTGDNLDQTSPRAVVGLNDAIAIAAGGYHSCALRASRSIVCWGFNGYGQLGNQTTNDSNTPVAVARLTRVAAIAAGGFHTCALMRDAGIECWGLDDDGQLGDTEAGPKPGATTPRGPVASQDLDGSSTGSLAASAITASIGVGWQGLVNYGGYFTCAIGTDTMVYCWGSDKGTVITGGWWIPGDLFIPIWAPPPPIPFATPAPAEYVRRGQMPAGHLTIAAGAFHACTLQSDGIRCWGDNTNGQLANGTFDETENFAFSGPIFGTAGATQVAAGGFHTCAVIGGSPEGRVVCWGNDGDGQVSGARGPNRASPVSVALP